LINAKHVALEVLMEKVISCRKCPRLANYISRVSKEKVRRFKDWCYWGHPLPGFGDPEARVLIIGLAPAAHGGNRTGRMFTGDSSGDWLTRALYETGFSNQPESVSRDDGLKLKDVYITAAARCAPPKNKPLAGEIRNCSEYLIEELRVLSNVKIILTLGRIAFDAYSRFLHPKRCELKPSFLHGGFYEIKDGPSLSVSYHPSRQNTHTGILTWEMWISLFNKIKQ
jgi:uracil-DNA glycosylase family 4